MAENELTFSVSCRTCHEDIVFKQAPAMVTTDRLTVRSIDLPCTNCGTTHIYVPKEFVPCEIDAA